MNRRFMMGMAWTGWRIIRMEVQKIPKNIRQIGGIEDWIKVYVEDYVVTYIHRLKAQGSAEGKYGILLGKKERADHSVYLFLSGAMEVTEEELSGESGQARIEETISQRFPGTQVWGWFLCDSDGQETSEEKAELMFRRYFQKEYQVLFWQREQEADFYVCPIRGLERLKGYHIYYERNEEMQEYMILSSPHFKTEPEEPKEELVDHYRKIMQEKKPPVGSRPGSASKKNYSFVHAASLVCVFLMGVMAFYGRQDMQTSALVKGQPDTQIATSRETSPPPASVIVREHPANLSPTQDTEADGQAVGQQGENGQAGLSSQQGESDQADENSQSGDEQSGQDGNGGSAGQADQNPDAAAGTETEALPTETQPEETNPPETPAQASVPETYQVEQGDTLQKISMRIYGNEDMIHEICEKNDISNPDFLFAGQILVLP